MRIITPDREQAKIDRELKEAKADIDLKRMAYLESLKKNGKFQKFVVQDIFRKNIDSLTNLNNIKPGEYEEMGKLVFQAMAAKKTLEKILSELLN